MAHVRAAVWALAALLLALGGSAAAQTGGLQALLELRVDAGYDGHFRELTWMPVRVSVINNGPEVSGRLVVRPETSGEGISNTFSAPVLLPQGAQQTLFLYITGRAFASQVRVELLSDAGAVLASADDLVRAVRPADRIVVTFSDATAGGADLSGAALGGFGVFQADWRTEQLPPLAEALAGIDLMLFEDVDTGAFSAAQRAALADWVRAGGHLIVAGGAAWQATAAGLTDLLPLVPDTVETVASLRALADWLALPDAQAAALATEALVAAGELAPDARVLAAVDGVPLVARRFLGNGVVDYLAAAPGAAPLRDWAGLGELWFTLETSRGPLPGWARGFENWAQAQQAVAIIPGIDPLPDILPLALFMIAYVLVVGPLNYLVLTRLDKRDWAWVTIPLSILVFSAGSWLIGSNLRGSEPILNQLTALRAWPGEPRGQADGLAGLLSPRRAQYTLQAGDGEPLRPIPQAAQGGSLLVRGAQSSVDIRQAEAFAAVNFAVDSSFVAGFNQRGAADAPAIGGSATLQYDPAIRGQMQARGAIRNDSGQVLRAPVVLGRGAALQLDDLAPGAVQPFELILAGEGPAAPAPYLPSTITPYLTFRTARGQNQSDQTAADVLGVERFEDGALITLSDEDNQRRLRDQLFVSALVDDSFDATGRGDTLYVAGWLDDAPLTTTLGGQTAAAHQTTLVIAALDTAIEPPGGPVTISRDRFTWAVRAYSGLGEVTPIDLNMQEGEEVTFRFTPLPTAVLDEVQQLTIVLDSLNVAVRRVPLWLYDWRGEDWVQVDVGREGLTISSDYARFLGPQNAVQVRLAADEFGGYLRIGALGIEQRGRMGPG
jgi:hypothetical protein